MKNGTKVLIALGAVVLGAILITVIFGNPKVAAATKTDAQLATSVESAKLVESKPAEEITSAEEVKALETVVTDFTCKFTGQLPMYCDAREAIREPGDGFTTQVFFEKAAPSVTLQRIAPDDILVSAVIYRPGESEVDITKMLNFVKIGKGGTGDPELDKVLKARGANIEDGEILMQNKTAISFSAPEGSYIIIKVVDDKNLQVNRGVFISLSGEVDTFTENID